MTGAIVAPSGNISWGREVNTQNQSLQIGLNMPEDPTTSCPSTSHYIPDSCHHYCCIFDEVRNIACFEKLDC